jgi:BirA family biotin operon repressor/biotin-[acetyl-CoA-carboxylase] ligase
MKGAISGNHSNTKFALLKITNLLPHPRKEKLYRTTFDNQLIELDSVDSTNNYAMARIHEGLASDGLVCLARHQWAGKGQRGKTWLDEPGQNLIMSLVIEPGTLILSQQFLFSAAVALGILYFTQSIKQDNWSIKWPNDIYWSDRKAAGILIETVVRGENWPFAVAGVGMNLNQDHFPSELPNTVSLKQITGNHYDPVAFAKDLVPSIQNNISILRKDPIQILSAFNQSLYKINQTVSLKKGDGMLRTCLKGVDDKGYLLTDHGSFTIGEVEFAFDR